MKSTKYIARMKAFKHNRHDPILVKPLFLSRVHRYQDSAIVYPLNRLLCRAASCAVRGGENTTTAAVVRAADLYPEASGD
mmetsp:Transcript_31264/g.45669  ORF Transcript_31264/g.45669 Transcript_31264/m.45669 type:complete len:80 (+) Transcript_31264:200-439(+)